MDSKQLEHRRKFLTATDYPAILGLSPWKSAADIQAEKLYPQKEGAGKEPAHSRLGKLLEPIICQWAEPEIGRKLLPGHFEVGGDELTAATPDRIASDCIEPDEGVEAKTSGVLAHRAENEEWGEPGSDEIPRMYWVQTQIQMYVCGFPRVYVPALIGGRGFAMYLVQRDDQRIGELVAFGHEWWERHVIRKQSLPAAPSLDILKRIRRQPKSIVDLRSAIDLPALITARAEAKAEARRLTERAEEAERIVVAALGEAEAGLLPSGELLTYFETKRKGYTVQDTTYRTLRVKRNADAIYPTNAGATGASSGDFDAGRIAPADQGGILDSGDSSAPAIITACGTEGG